jgi:hypothetical protein
VDAAGLADGPGETGRLIEESLGDKRMTVS